MSLVICDTNIFISLFRGFSDTVAELKNIGDENVLIPSVSVMELYRGMENKLKNYNVIHFNEQVSLRAIEFGADVQVIPQSPNTRRYYWGNVRNLQASFVHIQ